ncbi:hypothetical protein CR513_16265, partial [Mucuna pruriens]
MAFLSLKRDTKRRCWRNLKWLIKTLCIHPWKWREERSYFVQKSCRKLKVFNKYKAIYYLCGWCNLCFMESPTSTHMKAAKRILCYLKCTHDFGLFDSSSNEFKLMEFYDSAFTRDVDDRKNTTNIYLVATSCTCKTIWLRRLLKEFNMNKEESTKIHIDDKLAYVLAKNLVFHERSKCINRRYHFIRKCIIKKEVALVHVKTQDQVADIFTMSLKFEDFRRLRSRLGVQNFLREFSN